MKTKSKTMLWLIVVGVILILGAYFMKAYNGLVGTDEAVSTAWAQVESVYQRRADLIPNLVKTVEGAADFEKGTLKDVIEARSQATAVKIDPSNMSTENLAAFQKAQDGLSSALGRLMMVVERYPDLKANQNFRDLQAQLEGTENRISVERNKYNEVVKTYNTKIRRFPVNMVASMFDFEKKTYFEAKEGSENAPEVSFDIN